MINLGPPVPGMSRDKYHATYDKQTENFPLMSFCELTMDVYQLVDPLMTPALQIWRTHLDERVHFLR